MKTVLVELIALFLVAAQLPCGLSSQSTFPAFLWSPHHHEKMEAVNYQTLTPKNLTKSVLSEGGWSNLLCVGEEGQKPVDLALVLIGRELQSLDISGKKNANPALVDLLKISYSRSNLSLAYPYIVASEDKEETTESSLISGFKETCEQDSGVGKFTFSDWCSLKSEDVTKLSVLRTFDEFLVSRTEERTKGEADLVLFCNGSPEFDEPRSEAKVFSDIISSVEKSGAKYAVLYVTDPYRSISYPSYREVERFLAEGTFGNGSANSTTCDEVCQIKSSLLEGLFIGLILLIILISGLCCMAGIDTPTRFEAPQES